MIMNSQTEFRFLAEPTDVNFGGKVHGGMVMKWIDQASYACAAQWSKRYCVTVSANAIRFIRPILVGQMVTISAKIVHTGKTSMHIYVVVRAGDPKEDAIVVTNRCLSPLWLSMKQDIRWKYRILNPSKMKISCLRRWRYMPKTSPKSSI